jgi:serine protease
VRFAEPDAVYRVDTLPNDPLFGQLWGLNNTGQTVKSSTGAADADIDAPEAWSTTTRSSSVVVAVIDSGVDWHHPDLAANIWTNPG